MNKDQIEVGSCYRARVSGQFVTVRVDSINTLKTLGHGRYDYAGKVQPYKSRRRTTYEVTNLDTGRQLTFKSALRFRTRTIKRKGS